MPRPLVLVLMGLLALLAPIEQHDALAFPFQSIFGSSSSSSTTTTTTTTTNVLRLRANRLRKPELCRDSLPRKAADLPVLVITGRVKEVYLAGEQQAPGSLLAAQGGGGGVDQQQQQQQQAGSNKALVTVGRVIKGNQQLVGSDIIVGGFNSSSAQPCPNYVKPNDTLILLLNQEAERSYSIQGSNLLSMSLSNLDRVNAVAADEPPRRRGPIEDILCEAHYCPYGRCKADEQTGRTSCHCPDSCAPMPAPVCGSDNATYTNECHLIKEGCRRQKPLFVTKEASC